MRYNREDDFKAGIEILKPFFTSEGFELKVYPPVEKEEGTYFSAQFVWDKRIVTLIHLFGLSSVTYSVGGMMIEHGAYLEALTLKQDSAYPAQSDDPVDGYRALLSDFNTRMAHFFEEPDREFIEIASAHGQRGVPWLPADD